MRVEYNGAPHKISNGHSFHVLVAVSSSVQRNLLVQTKIIFFALPEA